LDLQPARSISDVDAPAPSGPPLLRVCGLSKTYTTGGLVGRGHSTRAVDDVSFELRRGESVALVGQSGSGKSSLARLLVRLERPDAGEIWLDGVEVLRQSRRVPLAFRARVQMVFQDPFASLNPVHKVRHDLARPLQIHHTADGDVEGAVLQLLHRVALDPPKKFADKFPHELSGGQRQRVAIARALAVRPRVLLADEPVSMLDVSIRLGVLNLLADLRDREHLAILYVTHDIASARYLADTIVVMYAGQLVEVAPSVRLTDSPAHPYTQLLLSAAPDPERLEPPVLAARGAPPSLLTPPPGCRFHPRCPHVMDICRRVPPPSVTVAPDHTAACWLHVDSSERTTDQAFAAPLVSSAPLRGESEAGRPP
jgi:peptide/nickel transport system ATP-binding protein